VKTGIIDYGAGNLCSVFNAVERVGGEPTVVTTPEGILDCDRLILPGVGAAAEAVARLAERGMVDALEEAVRTNGRPMLGICLGMQLLAETLHEFGVNRGLAWMAGEVVDLRTLIEPGFRVPHMGWNQVMVTDVAEDLFYGIRGKREFYFAHSYTLRTTVEPSIAAMTDHGRALVAAVQFDTVLGTQFHPEKSQVNGEKLLENFLDWTP